MHLTNPCFPLLQGEDAFDNMPACLLFFVCCRGVEASDTVQGDLANAVEITCTFQPAQGEKVRYSRRACSTWFLGTACSGRKGTSGSTLANAVEITCTFQPAQGEKVRYSRRAPGAWTQDIIVLLIPGACKVRGFWVLATKCCFPKSCGVRLHNHGSLFFFLFKVSIG